MTSELGDQLRKLFEGTGSCCEVMLADHVRDLDSIKSGRRRIQRFERLHRAGKPLDETVVLLNDVVEIFRPPDGDYPTPTAHHEQAVHVEQNRRIRSTFVDDNFVRPAIVADGFHEKRGCGGFATTHRLSVA